MPARALVLGLIVFAACGDEKEPNTPREAVLMFASALNDFDYDAARPHVVGDDLDLEHFQAFLDFARAGLEFKTKFLATYGDEGWAIFNDNEGASISVVQNRNLARFNRMRYEVDGDRAIGTMPNDPQKMHLERSDRHWSVRLRETMGIPEDALRNDAALYRNLARVIRDAVPRIGALGVTPAALDAELGAAMTVVFSKTGGMK